MITCVIGHLFGILPYNIFITSFSLFLLHPNTVHLIMLDARVRWEMRWADDDEMHYPYLLYLIRKKLFLFNAKIKLWT